MKSSTKQSDGKAATGLRVAVDIGGTFTDGVAIREADGRIWVGKTLTTPDDPGVAVSTVIESLLSQAAVKGDVLEEVVHGTTLVTNTLIERKGVQTALVTTQGMRDALDIGREWRYDLYDLELALPEPLIAVDKRVQVDERLGAAGQVLTPLTREELDRVAQAVRALNVPSVAVSLLHSYINDEHERAIGAFLQEGLPDVEVSLSSDMARELKEFERTSTVAANAYVKPIVADYLRQLGARIDAVHPGIALRIMVSSGGFTSAQSAAHTPIFLLESGPAAGVLSALNTARAQGLQQVLAFDMGGTTAKACAVTGGEPPIAYSFECARVHRFKRGSGLPILIPSIDLIEIGAGGGSIAHVNRLGLLNIGPESSGSVPGPACYGNGGTEVTVTDADLVLGYLNPDNFLGGEMRLRKDLALAGMQRLADQLGMAALEVAWGIHDMVNENMASAARIHIAEKGHDPRDFTFVATGGAGPVHAAEVARKLRIPRLLASIAAGAGSCLGMLAAPARADRSWSQPALLGEIDWDDVNTRLAALRADAAAELSASGAEVAGLSWTIGAEMRYYGQGDNVPVALDWRVFEGAGPDAGSDVMRAVFEQRYRELYGHLVPGALPQVLTWRLTGRSVVDARSFTWGGAREGGNVAPVQREIYLPLRRGFAAVNVYERYALPPGTHLQGPLVLEERESTLVVPFAADVDILADLTVSVTLKEFE
ncbi:MULTISPECIES: hydantoinase/oxoprolinase family protein [unclassified Achromobacter]|uniref:hydantoinase/oxoprolinase family protein n=1 Tax=unclassified Achromobacter TaxID=2626865 RepID=UPI001E6478AA|nr:MULTISPECIES: hydantoinase/oxoprolinase family protein [unclassified Achromobacter]